MRNPIQFILKFRNTLFFLLLQVIALAMLVQTQGYHQTAYMRATGDMVGALQTRRDNIRSYLHLREVNEQLHADIQSLQDQLDASKHLTIDSLTTYSDTLLGLKYRYLGARVVNSRTNTRANLMTLDRGSSHGITPSMGVLAGNKVVGVVKDLSENYAIVLPVIHSDFEMSVRLKGSGAVGSLTWPGEDARFALVSDVPRHVEPQKGDTLITTAYSGYFPEQMLVGVVEEVGIQAGANFLELKIALATHFASLEHVQVVENLLSKERRDLEAAQAPAP